MLATLAALLSLGLSLSQRISAQKQTLSKPLIWAKPGTIIPKGMAAIIWCEGAHMAVEYQLHFGGSLSTWERPNPPWMTNKVKFSIRPMTAHTAGQYSCSYRKGELWSEPSDPLDLVVTGMYDTPILSVLPGSQVTPGENVTFHCHLDTATSTFFLLKEGAPGPPQCGYGKLEAAFPMGPVTAAHRGTYRCFGSYNNHLWSFPSEPVVLLVTGDGGNTSLAPTGQPSSDTWAPPLLTTKTGHQKGAPADTLLRVGLALLALVALVCLLAEDWLRGEKTEREPGMRGKAPDTESPGQMTEDALAIGKADL